MDRVAWAMRYGLPNQKYLEFVARYLLKLEEGGRRDDPFAPDVLPKERWNVYVVRKDVEKELTRWDSQIILGPPGSGKTTLFRTLQVLPPGKILVVRLPLAEIGTSVPEQDLLESKASLLTPAPLANYIFNAYWEDLVRNNRNRGRHLPRLLREQWWIERLRWFYNQRPPLHPHIGTEAELMERLHVDAPHPPLNPQASPRDVLRELVRFVTSARVYVHVQIRIDGVESLSALAAARLLRDVQSLHDLYLENVSFKLFADSTLKTQVEAMPCVRDGRVGIYVLPPWREEELRELLDRRLKAPGEALLDVEGPHRPHQYLNILYKYMTRDAQNQFFELVARGALQGKNEGCDAPLHVLRLARGIFAAAAECWEEFPLPLNPGKINHLITCYWQAG